MNIPLKELRERAAIEITNKIVNNMTMSEVMDVVIKYSEQTARLAVKGLGRKRLQQIIGEVISIDKKIKRKPVNIEKGPMLKKHSGWNSNRERKTTPKKKARRLEPEQSEPKKSWLDLFGGGEKRHHTGWNKKKTEGGAFWGDFP